MMPASRTVGRYRRGPAWLAGLSGVAAILVVLVAPGGATPKVDKAVEPQARRVGMSSCAARGCHGAVAPVEPTRDDVYIRDGSYTTWLNFDPHARAFDVLLEPRSVAMAGKLKLPAAHEAGLCLSCHATSGPPDPISPEVSPARDGITCESCHGPAEVWQQGHLSADWRARPAASKALDGLADLSTPRKRAESCVGCHVGDRSRGMDMNHDLIAAGHPRLNFEFASYQAGYPKHWKEKPGAGADFEAKSWAIGQVVTSRAVLKLLADRAVASKEGAPTRGTAPEAVWPEFSEYECFACHHELVAPSVLQEEAHFRSKSGRLPWATWPSAMLPLVSKGGKDSKIEVDSPDSPWAQLRAEMARVLPDPDRVAALAGGAIRQLDALLDGLEATPIDGGWVASMASNLTNSPTAPAEGWDRMAQEYLALSALARASRDLGSPADPARRAALDGFRKRLEFPPNYDSPHAVRPGDGPER